MSFAAAIVRGAAPQELPADAQHVPLRTTVALHAARNTRQLTETLAQRCVPRLSLSQVLPCPHARV